MPRRPDAEYVAIRRKNYLGYLAAGEGHAREPAVNVVMAVGLCLIWTICARARNDPRWDSPAAKFTLRRGSNK
jgi:hypothetical protein